MTEVEWLSATAPTRLLRFIHTALVVEYHESPAELRRSQLFRVACCERVEHLLTDARSRSALSYLRRYADGQVCIDEFRAEAESAHLAYRSSFHDLAVARFGPTIEPHIIDALSGRGLENELLSSDPSATAAKAVSMAVLVNKNLDRLTARNSARAVQAEHGSEASAREQLAQTELLRCIFGNPFRPVTFPDAWRTETTVALAAGIYDERAFDRLPILADALEEAGCDNADVLNHCRGPGPHARGCWVVDGVLGKE
jgi:hypothetical protein